MRYLLIAILALCFIGPLVLFILALLSINIIELYDRLLRQQRSV